MPTRKEIPKIVGKSIKKHEFCSKFYNISPSFTTYDCPAAIFVGLAASLLVTSKELFCLKTKLLSFCSLQIFSKDLAQASISSY